MLTLSLSNRCTIQSVTFLNSRPTNIGQLLCGKTPEQALTLLPKLFLLCSQAQQAAALGALAKARHQPLSETDNQHLARRCALEWLKEHCWQLWQMQRELFGPDYALAENLTLNRLLLKRVQALPAVNQQLAAPTDLPVTSSLLTPLSGCDGDTLLHFSWRELERWMRQPQAYPKLIAAVVDAGNASLGANENWQAGQESGCLARQQHHPLIRQALDNWGSGLATRLLARYIEIVAVCKQPLTAIPVAEGIAQASRGEVSHSVQLDQCGHISSYRINAPTDRYFSPQGCVEQALLGQQLNKEGALWLRQLIRAIDPCVDFSICIRE